MQLLPTFPSLWICRSHSPAALLAVDRPFGVVLTVFQVGLQLVQPQCGCAAKACVVTAHLKLGQHVAHDAGHRPEVSQCHHSAVHGANLLLGKPLCDAGIAEGVLAVRSLVVKMKIRQKTTHKKFVDTSRKMLTSSAMII